MRKLKLPLADGQLVIELARNRTGILYLSIDNDRFALSTPVAREDAAKMRKWLNEYLAVGCLKHGAEHCIECEKRCECCGNDGDMKRRGGQRLCECCAYSYDQGDFG